MLNMITSFYFDRIWQKIKMTGYHTESVSRTVRVNSKSQRKSRTKVSETKRTWDSVRQI